MSPAVGGISPVLVEVNGSLGTRLKHCVEMNVPSLLVFRELCFDAPDESSHSERSSLFAQGQHRRKKEVECVSQVPEAVRKDVENADDRLAH
jgi:hypothetical protein